MKNHWNYLLIFLFSISISTASAQKHNLYLLKTYKAALERYPGIDEKTAEIQVAKFQSKFIKSKQLPQARFQLQNSFGTLESSSGAFFPLPGMFNINGAGDTENVNNSFNIYGSVLADWEIFSFGKLSNEYKASGLKILEAQSDLSIYELNLKSIISRLFLKILYDDLKLKWSQSNAFRVNEIFKISKVLASAGLKPGADTSLASSSYFQLLADEDLLRGRLESSKHQLNEFTAFDFSEMNTESNNFLNVGVFKIADGAYNNHPYLGKISHQIEYQNTLKEATQRAILPSLSLLAGYSLRGSSAGGDLMKSNWPNGFNNGSANYLIGVGITWNLTGIYGKSLKRKEIEQQGKIAESNYKQQELELNAGILSAHSQISAQVKQVSKTKIGVEKANEAYLLYRTRYENGLINLTDLLQIQFLLQQAEEKQIEAYKGLWEQVIIQSELTADFSNLFEIF